jgi:hypothetical protein
VIPRRALALVLSCCIVLFLPGCTSFAPQSLADWPDPSVVRMQARGDVEVSAGILTDAQAARLYGVDLPGAGLQAIWLRIENRSAHGRWLLSTGLDPNYYPPDEAAALFNVWRGAKTGQRIVERFRSLAIPQKAAAGATIEGFVLAPRHEGGRYVNVGLAGHEGVLEFGFAVPLADGEFDFERLDAARIYAGVERPDLGLDALRVRLREMPCCTLDESGSRQGDPLNLVLIGEAPEVLAALSRGGWSFTHRLGLKSVRRMVAAAISGSPYPVAPVSPLYAFGRPQDLALQRARGTIVQRNHLRIWLAPFRHAGRSVWVGQVSRDIGVKASLHSGTLTTHVIDPNVDEARENLLQSLMMAGMTRRFGFVAGVPPASASAPRENLAGDPYFTDGLRVVVELSAGAPVSPADVRFIEWRESADPATEWHEDAAGTRPD